MKISDSRGRSLEGVGASGATGKIAGAGSSAPQTSGSDRVQLSNLSAHLAVARGDSPEHLAKLMGLQSEVFLGRYRVGPKVVSDSIIRHSLQFGGANYI